MTRLPQLSPAQRAVADEVIGALDVGSFVTLSNTEQPGLGVSTILRVLQSELGGKVLSPADLYEETRGGDPRRYETAFFSLVEDALAHHEIVYIDRIDLISVDYYSRWGLADLALLGGAAWAAEAGRKLVLAGANLPAASRVTMRPLGVEDYRQILEQRRPDVDFSAVDFTLVKFVAGNLNAVRLTNIAAQLSSCRNPAAPSTADLFDLVRRETGGANAIAEEDGITLEKLAGLEDVVEKLTRTVLLPHREPALAHRVGLEAKHGVMIHGASGMGKTTIARALAQELGNKFFLLDGDYNHEEMGCFFKRVRALFEQARHSAPSVIFIDDADIILSDPGMQHWGRYLLTMIDGLRSDVSSGVCVMMAAMNLSNMPGALLRSGRLEVWLELTPPAAEARRKILQMHLARLPFDAEDVDLTEAVDGTDGFSPADLRRVVSDAVGFMAADMLGENDRASIGTYVRKAIGAMRKQQASVRKVLGGVDA